MSAALRFLTVKSIGSIVGSFNNHDGLGGGGFLLGGSLLSAFEAMRLPVAYKCFHRCHSSSVLPKIEMPCAPGGNAWGAGKRLGSLGRSFKFCGGEFGV